MLTESQRMNERMNELTNEQCTVREGERERVQRTDGRLSSTRLSQPSELNELDIQ